MTSEDILGSMSMRRIAWVPFTIMDIAGANGVLGRSVSFHTQNAWSTMLAVFLLAHTVDAGCPCIDASMQLSQLQVNGSLPCDGLCAQQFGITPGYA